MIRTGTLDRFITIQRKTVTMSDSGGQVEAWSNLAIRRAASMWPIKGTESSAPPETTAVEQIEFRIRYSSELADLSPLDRVIYPALTQAQADDVDYVIPPRSIYDVQGVLEINHREGFRILTSRRPDVA